VDPILRALIAFIAALNAATGAPADVEHMPDRPPIVAPTARSIPAVDGTAASSQTDLPKITAISGKITNVQDGQITVNGQNITLDSNTQVTGQLKVGASVKVVVRVREDGRLEAGTLEVGEDSAPSVTANPTEKPDSQTAGKPEVKPTDKPQGALTGNSESKSTETPESKPAVAPEVKPPPQPAAQPTEKPEVKPPDKPSGSGDSNKSGGDSSKTSTSGQTSGGDSKSSGDGGSGD